MNTLDTKKFFKTILSALVVLSFLNVYFNKAILAFIYPLIFLTEGFFLFEDDERNYGRFVVNKFFSLIVPYLTICFFDYFFRKYFKLFRVDLFLFAGLENSDWKSILKLKYVSPYIDCIRFFPALFIASSVVKFIQIYFRNFVKYLFLILLLVVYVFIHILWNKDLNFPLCLDIGAVASFFMLFGFLIRENKNRISVPFLGKGVFVLVSYIFFAILQFKITAAFDIKNYTSINPVIVVIATIISFYLLLNLEVSFSDLKENEKFLLFGDNSTALLVFTPLIIKIVNLIDNAFLITVFPVCGVFIYAVLVFAVFYFLNNILKDNIFYEKIICGGHRVQREIPLCFILMFVGVLLLICLIRFPQSYIYSKLLKFLRGAK